MPLFTPILPSISVHRAKFSHRPTSDNGKSKLPSSTKPPRATEGASSTHLAVTTVGKPSSQKGSKALKEDYVTGRILYSVRHSTSVSVVSI